jgi:hypothetical protein
MGRGQIIIERPVEEVFDAVADETRPYDPRIIRAQKVTPGPIGPGTRFQSETRGQFGAVPTTVELTEFDRPRFLRSTTPLARLQIDATLTFAPCERGTRLTWASRLRLRGLLRPLTPLISLAGRRQERRIWAELKRALERNSGGR